MTICRGSGDGGGDGGSHVACDNNDHNDGPDL